jgi:NAD(P)H-hydrate epimerase
LEACSGSVSSAPKDKKQLIMDADALNILSCHPELMHLAAGTVFTPHAKEYHRLFSDSAPQIMANMHNLVIVKKAHRTQIYAPGVEPIVNVTGNAGMATAGSGDVLTGITLGLMAQAVAYRRRHNDVDLSTQQISALAVNIHGQAGDIAASRQSQAALIASDIIDSISDVYVRYCSFHNDGK